MLPSLDQHEVPVSVAVVVHDEAWSVQAYSQRQQLTVEHQSLHHAMGAIQATAEGQCLGPFPAVLMSPKNLRSTGQVDLRCWLKGVQHNKALTPYGPGNYLLVLFERVPTHEGDLCVLHIQPKESEVLFEESIGSRRRNFSPAGWDRGLQGVRISGGNWQQAGFVVPVELLCSQFPPQLECDDGFQVVHMTVAEQTKQGVQILCKDKDIMLPTWAGYDSSGSARVSLPLSIGPAEYFIGRTAHVHLTDSTLMVLVTPRTQQSAVAAIHSSTAAAPDTAAAIPHAAAAGSAPPAAAAAALAPSAVKPVVPDPASHGKSSCAKSVQLPSGCTVSASRNQQSSTANVDVRTASINRQKQPGGLLGRLRRLQGHANRPPCTGPAKPIQSGGSSSSSSSGGAKGQGSSSNNHTGNSNHLTSHGSSSPDDFDRGGVQTDLGTSAAASAAPAPAPSAAPAPQLPTPSSPSAAPNKSHTLVLVPTEAAAGAAQGTTPSSLIDLRLRHTSDPSEMEWEVVKLLRALEPLLPLEQHVDLAQQVQQLFVRVCQSGDPKLRTSMQQQVEMQYAYLCFAVRSLQLDRVLKSVQDLVDIPVQLSRPASCTSVTAS